jgi:hypothetical protein
MNPPIQESEELAYRAEMLRRAGDRLLHEARELAAKSQALLNVQSTTNERPAEVEQSFLYVVK